MESTSVDIKQSRTDSSAMQAVRHAVQVIDPALPALVFALHSLFVMTFAALAARYALALPVTRAIGYRLPERDGWQRLIVSPLSNWDGYWYSLIAERGYGIDESTTAFWPLYPWMMRLVSNVLQVGPDIAGLILSNIAFFGALIVLHRLVTREWGYGVARRSLWLIAFFPTAFYFSAVYSESFFLLFVLLAFYLARTDRWWLAGIAAVLAALTRNVGVLLIIPFVVMYAKQHRIGRGQFHWNTLAVFAPVLGPLIYFAILWLIYRDPLLTVTVQHQWARTQAMPWETFQMAVEQADFSWVSRLLDTPSWSTLTSYETRITFAEYESFDIIMAALIIPLLAYTVLRLPLEYGLFTVIVFVLPLFSPSTIHPLMSIARFALVLFPLFIGLALLLRRRALFLTWLGLSATVLALLTIQFSTWFWVA